MKPLSEINKTRLLQAYRRKREFGCRYPFMELAEEFGGDRRKIADYVRSRVGTNDQVSGGVAQEDKPVRVTFTSRIGGTVTISGDDREAVDLMRWGMGG